MCLRMIQYQNILGLSTTLRNKNYNSIAPLQMCHGYLNKLRGVHHNVLPPFQPEEVFLEYYYPVEQ